MQKKSKGIVIGAILLVVLIAAAALVFVLTRPDTVVGDKRITVHNKPCFGPGRDDGIDHSVASFVFEKSRLYKQKGGFVIFIGDFGECLGRYLIFLHKSQV